MFRLGILVYIHKGMNISMTQVGTNGILSIRILFFDFVIGISGNSKKRGSFMVPAPSIFLLTISI